MECVHCNKEATYYNIGPEKSRRTPYCNDCVIANDHWPHFKLISKVDGVVETPKAKTKSATPSWFDLIPE